MNDDALQKNNTDFPSGAGWPYYMKIETFHALIKHVPKTSSMYNWNSLGVKDL